MAIGRKNWMFVGSKDGGEAAAVICSLIQSCRALKINPRPYLEDVMRRLMDHPFNRLEELLPDQWLASQRKDEDSSTVGFR
jgi:transposase